MKLFPEISVEIAKASPSIREELSNLFTSASRILIKEPTTGQITSIILVKKFSFISNIKLLGTVQVRVTEDNQNWVLKIGCHPTFKLVMLFSLSIFPILSVLVLYLNFSLQAIGFLILFSGFPIALSYLIIKADLKTWKSYFEK